ncbi:MAG: hypothetical protein WDO74_29005 [Pseudomonadota bacterium]
MHKKIFCLGLLSTFACSSGAGHVDLRSAAATPALSTAEPALVAKGESATTRAPLEYRLLDDSDRVFVENAERAIGQYTEFIARAGASEEYAPAVKRSREQIEDLRAAIDFVLAGAERRAAH